MAIRRCPECNREMVNRGEAPRRAASSDAEQVRPGLATFIYECFSHGRFFVTTDGTIRRAGN